jgi:hypothetical protein
MKLVTIEKVIYLIRTKTKKRTKISPISHQTGACMSTFPDQTSALIPCTRLYPNNQRMIDNLGTLVRIRCAETKTARKTAQTKDRKASMVPVKKKSSEKPEKEMAQVVDITPQKGQKERGSRYGCHNKWESENKEGLGGPFVYIERTSHPSYAVDG